MQYLINLLEFLSPYGTQSYYVMFAILIACGFGFPMPEDIVLISGGILAARGITDFNMVFLVTMAGVLMGDGAVFFLGRKFGPSIKAWGVFRKVISEKNDRKVMHIFSKYGDKVIFMARFMPGLRMPLFMTAGIYQVPPWKFFALDGFAALISVPVWIWVGYIFGNNLEVLEERIRQFQVGIYVSLALILAGFIALHFWRKKRAVKKGSIASEATTN